MERPARRTRSLLVVVRDHVRKCWWIRRTTRRTARVESASRVGLRIASPRRRRKPCSAIGTRCFVHVRRPRRKRSRRPRLLRRPRRIWTTSSRTTKIPMRQVDVLASDLRRSIRGRRTARIGRTCVTCCFANARTGSTSTCCAWCVVRPTRPKLVEHVTCSRVRVKWKLRCAIGSVSWWIPRRGRLPSPRACTRGRSCRWNHAKSSTAIAKLADVPTIRPRT
mmetsp:Transcript_2207/g.14626  ORF Transcript_2207/g.14626 Transcript_2207/m.14626 type:complete len:222 (+) Transcript_2207:300-965(+)